MTFSVGGGVGGTIGFGVGGTVGSIVGNGFGLGVGNGVGFGVGDDVISRVGFSVGDKDGFFVAPETVSTTGLSGSNGILKEVVSFKPYAPPLAMSSPMVDVILYDPSPHLQHMPSPRTSDMVKA